MSKLVLKSINSWLFAGGGLLGMATLYLQEQKRSADAAFREKVYASDSVYREKVYASEAASRDKFFRLKERKNEILEGKEKVERR
jgi:hypothetical protein